MKLLFLSNYYTHHQHPTCKMWNKLTNNNFIFAATEEFSLDRKKLGWRQQNEVSFVRFFGDEISRDNENIIENSDVVILGNAPLKMISTRLKKDRIVFKYSERVYKSKYHRWKWLPRVYTFWRNYGRHKSLYLLSASAFTTYDFARHGTFLGKTYKWGYFPETRHYNIDRLLGQKDYAKILWCGRFLDWKHPDIAIQLARRLKAEGITFSLDFIGTGEMEDFLRQGVEKYDLTEYVSFLGSMSSEEVRSYMEKAGIFLFTSDFREGWGAVLNESMNSGCAVVASHAIGSVPFLIQHNENGLIYVNESFDDFYNKVKFLLIHPDKQKKFGEKAYATITNLWNAELAAERFLKLAEEVADHGYCDLYSEGPCSIAPVIKNDWFKEYNYDY